MEYTLQDIQAQADETINAFAGSISLRQGEIVVVGCSTSEVAGAKIGTQSSMDIASVILDALFRFVKPAGVYIAVQCCEHLNRALVVERDCAEKYHLEIVNVRPVMKAGSALATCAYERFTDPVVVESIRAHAGIDIGDTVIGMHLKAVVVPVRTQSRRIGNANVVMARTRPKYIGGPRAHYEE